MKDLKPTKLCNNCFNPHQNMGIYCVQCDKSNKTMTITREQFDSLKVGDELKSDINNTILVVQGTIGKIIIVKSINAEVDDNEIYISSCTYCIEELISGGYSINKPIQHNCGFPFGNYEDREVIVKVSDESIEDCDNKTLYVRLKSVNKKEFQDFKNISWKFAVLVSNNVDLIKP